MFNVKVIGADTSKNSGVAKELLASTDPARLFTATGYNSAGTTLFLQLHDAAAAPADTAVPKLVLQVPAQTCGSFDFGDGKIFAAGIYVCWSSTDVAKTLVAANSGIIDCTFRKTE